MVALGVSELATPHHTACQMDLPKSQILGTTSKVHRTFRERGKREGEEKERDRDKKGKNRKNNEWRQDGSEDYN